MKRPTFFISSTIYDFADLRSSIKYFLEQQGCHVLASEFNDFRKPLDKHSYQACLDAIEQADYFILLVGSRVGGWYDHDEKISITQQEYRTAYQLHMQGRLKIINFVRSDLWKLKSDRNELKKYLEKLDMDKEQANKIANYPTNRASDSEFIIKFLIEIGRNKDTKQALAGEKSLPTGNWIHVFSSFANIADVLAPEVFDGTPIDEAVMRKLLHSELKEILRKCLYRTHEGKVLSPTICIRNFYAEHDFEIDVREHGFTSVNCKRWDMLSSYSIALSSMEFNPIILPQALSSSTFLKFNHKSGGFEEELLLSVLRKLHEEIRLFNKSNITETLEVVFENTRRHRSPDDQEVQIESLKLLSLLHLMQRWSNVIILSKSVIRFLQNDELKIPEIFDKSPILEKIAELAKEVVKDKELDEFIEGDGV